MTPSGTANEAPSPVTEAEIREDIAVLADDRMEGHAPGTAGETLAVHYIATRLAQAGFSGAADAQGGWYQPVPLVALSPGIGLMTLSSVGNRAAPNVGPYVLRAPDGVGHVEHAPLIFVGYGVDAAGTVRADVRGKIALVLMNDRTGDNAMGARKRRDAVIAAGALATITVPASAMPFDPLERRYRSTALQLADRMSAAEVEGIVSGTFADALLATSGADAMSVRRAADADDFAGIDLPLHMTLHAVSQRRAFNSYNVVARLAGHRPAAGSVLLTGHWDHLGLCRPEGAEDRICNGAVDNASGIAVLLAVARRLSAGPRPERDVLIVATTAEESGLLGAYHLAAHPPVPITSIAINLNVDTVAVAGRGAPVAIIGRSDMQIVENVQQIARNLGRPIDGDGDADAFVRRQDGWALAQAGVPAIMAGGSFSDMPALEHYLEGDYHGPDDELTEATPLGGAADDADLHVALARYFADSRLHPNNRPQ